MSSKHIVHLTEVSKHYRVYENPKDRLLELVTGDRTNRARVRVALERVSCTIRQGEAVGIIGRNGSGKSTLLQIMAQIVNPTAGTVHIDGRVCALLELGAGFNPAFTGLENAYMNAALYGVTEQEFHKRIDAVLAFADLGEAIGLPVKTYSTGMYMRLAFATAVHLDPDILLIDEALAVGDAVFQVKCLHRLKALQARGCTILLASHDLHALKALCDRILYLDRGYLKAEGEPERITNLYQRDCFGHQDSKDREDSEGVRDGTTSIESVEPSGASTIYGNGQIELESARLLNRHGQPITRCISNDHITVEVRIQPRSSLPQAVVGFLIRDQYGVNVVATNTHEEGVPLQDLHPKTLHTIRFSLHLPLRPGGYSLSVGISDDEHASQMFAWQDFAVLFEIGPRPDYRAHGLVYLPTHISLVTSDARSTTCSAS